MKVKQRISEIEEAIDELEKLFLMDEESFLRNRTARFSARYSIVQVVEAAADIGLHVLERRFNESPESYRDVFRKLALHGIVSPNTAEEMSKLAGLRNIVVHRYWDVDDLMIYREAKSNGLESVRRFLKEVMSNLPEEARGS
ncbi:MAG: DUF86 domain-containing protein [Candidatus Korarchaeum sp.]